MSTTTDAAVNQQAQQQQQALPPELERLAAQLKQEAEATAPPAPEPERIRVEVAGSVFEGTESEIIEKMKASIANGNERLAELNRIAKQQQQQAPPPVASGPEPVKPQEFYEAADRNPAEAISKVLGSQLGLPPEQVMPTLRAAVQSAHFVAQNAEVAQFHERCPDYVPTPSNRDAMVARMQETGRPSTADALALTYYELERAGRISKPEAPPAAPPPPKPAPSLGGVPSGDAASGDELAKAAEFVATASDADVRAYFRKIGAM